MLRDNGWKPCNLAMRIGKSESTTFCAALLSREHHMARLGGFKKVDIQITYTESFSLVTVPTRVLSLSLIE